jgi:hypothetical protein
MCKITHYHLTKKMQNFVKIDYEDSIFFLIFEEPRYYFVY